MKICAVICEYNPFHSGHLYQLNQVPAKYDRRICIMSGNFVQRAEPAIIDKRVRASVALNSGADLVIENPILNAVSNGERFADGAVGILSLLPDVSGLIMGCETDKPDLIKIIADQQLSESNEFKEVFSQELGKGKSYAAAYSEATVAALKREGHNESQIRAILKEPNNLLCIEYIKSIKRKNLDVEPIIIKRKGNGYHSVSVFGDFLSATAIRELLLSPSTSSAAPYLPCYEQVKKVIDGGTFANTELYDTISLYNLRNSSPAEIASLYDCAEGLEFALYNQATMHNSLSDTLQAVKSKRYTYARLKRIILQLNLGITKEIMKKAHLQPLPFHILAIKNDFKNYLADISKNAVIRNSDHDKFPEFNYLFEIEKRASALYSTVCKTIDCYQSEKLITDSII